MGAPLGDVVGPTVRVCPDLAAASAMLARDLLRQARAATKDRGRFRWVLSGGSTPQPLYRLLVRRYRSRFPWAQTEIFFGDERAVAPRRPESNYGAARGSFLSEVPIPPRRVHRMRGDLRPLSEAARRYARSVGRIGPPREAPPAFDVVLLGIGVDGHTASLFPRQPALRERRRAVVAVGHPGQPPFVPRLTLTLPALASSRQVSFLVAGPEKARPIARVFRSFPHGDVRLPASLVRSQGPTLWYLDEAAAAELPASVARSGPGETAG